MKKILLGILILIFMQGCSTLGNGQVDVPNFQDGTWSACTYTSKSGASRTIPLQLHGAPLEWIEPDGTGVKCKAIPINASTPAPVPAPE